MKIKSAVLRETNRPITIEELELDPPKEKEVLIKNAFTGFCHSDLSLINGAIVMDLPFAIGHEAAGVVVEVGPGVTKLKKGEHVVPTWMIPCGKCPQCLRGRGNICSGTIGYFSSGMLLDGTSRLRDKRGDMVRHNSFVSGFSTHSVVPENGAIPISKELPLDQACFMGCCVPTGWGAVNNTADVQAGQSVVVYGAGGVGLNVIRSAALRHANPIIVVDLEASKEGIARDFGATHFIDSSKGDPVPQIQELTGGQRNEEGTMMDGGAEVVFEVTGDTGAQVQGLWSTAVGGKLVTVGVAPMDQTAALATGFLPLHEKSILGTLYGSISTHLDIPMLVDLALKGHLMTEKLTSNKFRVEEINDVAKAIERREVIGRWVCEWV
jgi:S-(hydroxymethyl)glutathione dehydrogenase/alcohol dehydrogenase